MLIINFFFVGCSSNPYREEISKLRPGMSADDLVKVFGKPYGDTGNMLVFYKRDANTMLGIYDMLGPHGENSWILLEVPPEGISQKFTYYKVKEVNDSVLIDASSPFQRMIEMDKSGETRVSHVGLTIDRVP